MVILVSGMVLSLSAKVISVSSSGRATITQAVVQAQSGDTIMVDDGHYRERVLLAQGIVLLARNQYGAIIDGGGRGTVLTLNRNNVVSGFEIRNGTIGIFSNSAGNVVKGCRIIRNLQTGMVVVRHLPLIEDNIIAFNRASGIQGWDVRSTTSSVNHNTIAYNGHHAVALGGSSNILLENNVFAFNERFGLKLDSDAHDVRVMSNNFYQNLAQFKGIPEGNYSFNPAFRQPRLRLAFTSDPARCCKIKAADNDNLGARLSH
jgi:nitrous oxidase accessory protein NosD